MGVGGCMCACACVCALVSVLVGVCAVGEGRGCVRRGRVSSHRHPQFDPKARVGSTLGPTRSQSLRQALCAYCPPEQPKLA